MIESTSPVQDYSYYANHQNSNFGRVSNNIPAIQAALAIQRLEAMTQEASITGVGRVLVVLA